MSSQLAVKSCFAYSQLSTGFASVMVVRLIGFHNGVEFYFVHRQARSLFRHFFRLLVIALQAPPHKFLHHLGAVIPERVKDKKPTRLALVPL